jgi:hypothetical protein
MAMAGVMLMTARPATAAEAESTASASARHVRSSNAAIVVAIERATEASATFRHLVDVINASDGVVYVEDGECTERVRACFTAVTVAGPLRMMQVIVNARRVDSELMVSIGHELRHTIEVIDSPSVRNNADKYFLYKQIGTPGLGGGRETQAAVDAADAVRSELRKFNRRVKPE